MKESIEWIPTGYLVRDITRLVVIKPGLYEPFDFQTLISLYNKTFYNVR